MGSLTNWRGAGLTLAPLFTFWYNGQGDDMRRRYVKLAASQEEKAANIIIRLLSDLTLDLHNVGSNIVRGAPTVIYKRFIEVAESALYEKELQEEYDRDWNQR